MELEDAGLIALPLPATLVLLFWASSKECGRTRKRNAANDAERRVGWGEIMIDVSSGWLVASKELREYYYRK
jgi:hypothetical protein